MPACSGLARMLLFLVVQHAVAVALKIFVCYLTAKFLAYALVLLGTLRTAGAVSAGSAQPLLYRTHHILVFVQTDFGAVNVTPPR